MSRLLRVCAIGILLLYSASSFAQSSACQAPVLKPAAAGANIFNDKQEMELAAVLHRKLEQDVKMIEDEALTGELQRVGDRIARSLTQGIKFHYYVIDIPEANAFSQPGGNIYFSKKIIAFFKSEDELAGVMAHEMGHIVTHQGTVEMSRKMKNVLGISKFEDDDDIESKYNDLLDSYRKKPGAFREKDREQQDQLGADQVAVYALGASGYNVKAMAGFWDRFTENRGRKGNFFTDMFGGTSEEQRRFRDMLKNASAISPECVGKHPETSDADFNKWKTAVLAYEGIGHREKLDGLITRKPLTPPLRPELTKLRISPDGKYVIAQDPGSIAVLTREGLKPLFRIDAEEARSVQFTADSKQIIFYTLSLFTSPRIEVWDIAEQSMHTAYELRIPNGCNQAALSPDAKYFACVYPNLEQSYGGILFNLRILNTETGETAFEKKGFFNGNIFSIWTHLWTAIYSGEELQVMTMKFSPDSKYLLCGREDNVFAMEAATGTKVNLPNSIKDLMRVDFAFQGRDLIMGTGGSKGEKGAVVKFPSGEVVYSNLQMGRVHIEGVARGDYAIMSPMKDYAVGIFDLKANKYVMAYKKAALEIWGDEYLHERGDGELETVEATTGKPRMQMPLADGPLGRVVASAASDDLNYIAISGTTRGAVWNVNKGTRVMHFRRFNGVGVDNTGYVFADFPEEGETKRLFAQVNLNTGQATSFKANEDSSDNQIGEYLIQAIPAKKGEWKKNITFQIKSVRNNLVLWTRNFQNGLPAFFIEDDIDSLVFAYDVNDSDGKTAMQGNDELHSKVQALKTKAHAYAVESVDLKTGKTNGVMALDTGKGSFKLRDAFRAGPYVVTTDTNDRVQVFGFDGTRKGRLQSHGAMGTRDGKVLAVMVGRGKLAIYDMQTFKQVNELDFSSRVAMFRFSSDGNRLLVVTRDQKAYYFDTKQMLTGTQVASAK